MVSVAAARDRAHKRVERDLREWAAFGGEGAEFSVPLNPPVERAALADLGAAIAWAREWRDVAGTQWGTRQWPSAGAQRVPVRLVLRGAEAIAAFAGRQEARDWRKLSERTAWMREALGPVAASVGRVPGGVPGPVPNFALSSAGTHLSVESAVPDALAGSIRTHGRALLALADDDFSRLVDVVLWFAAYPESGWRIRQLPIRGIDTKWLARHRAVVTGLHLAVTGRASLGLTANPSLVRVRILDPALRPGGLCDISAPAEELARLDIEPERVFVFENLETVLAMPAMPGAAVIHGGGYGVDERVRSLPWALGHQITYWGDLDSHGFAILNQLRTVCPDAAAVLMDEETLLGFRDLWVPEPDPTTGVFPLLTGPEQATLARLRTEGNVRLEQERITWRHALDVLLPLP